MAPIASRFAGLPALVVVYAVTCAALGGLRFPLTGDEIHFWRTTLAFFAASPLPSIASLRGYVELNTPLPFVVWGALEYWLHQGPWLPRALNLAASFAVVALIAGSATEEIPPEGGSYKEFPQEELVASAFRRNAGAIRHMLAAVGLLLCPYYLFVSAHIYTDMPAICFATFGLFAYVHQRHVLAAVLFALAIACRQYAVAFPLAIVGHEIAAGTARRSPGPLMAAAAAAATLGGWFAFFGGIAPPAAIEAQGIVTAPLAVVIPRNALYLLACVGLYFAVPAAVLFRRSPRLDEWRRSPMLVAAAALLMLFVLFPPLRNEGVPTVQMGLFDRTLHAVGLPNLFRVAVYYAFAVTAVVVVSRAPLALSLTACNALVTLKGHLVWDKHALPLIVALWFLASRDRIWPPFPLDGMRKSSP